MAFKIILLTLIYSSCSILLSEGSAANQTNSTQNPGSAANQTNSTQYSTVVASATPQTINTSTASLIRPSSTIVQASSSLSGDTFQISAGQGSSGGRQTRFVILPPENERRDYSLTANTRLHWVRYLLDKDGPEFSALKQFIEVHLNEIFKDVSGFLKTEVTEFIEDKVTFLAIIYTRTAEQVSKNDLKYHLTKFTENTNEMKIYAFEITPRFTEMPNQANVAKAFSPPKGEEAEIVDGTMSFLQGFGAMFALIVVFGTIGFIKYRACNYKKMPDSDQKTSLQQVYDNEAIE